MWTKKDPKFTPRGFPFYTPQHNHNKNQTFPSPPSSATRKNLPPASEKKWKPPQSKNDYNVGIIHKVPSGDSPYARAKHVQVVDKNPSKAVAMFWAAINLGDRVDSALKDMTIAMKQLDRADEAIEAIKSFRHLCPLEAQESLDNIMFELYKKTGSLLEQEQLLELRLKHFEDATTQNVNEMRNARCQGKKIQITMGQEYTKVLGNLAWLYLQQDKYKQAEEMYRKALSLEQDKNRQCNLAICLMYTNRMTEAKFVLNSVENLNINREMYLSYAKSYERAIKVMNELESCKHDTSFSSFLSRNKETDSSEEQGNNGNCESMQSDTPFGSKNMGIPTTPFTQPRMHERPVLDGGCFRKLQFGQSAETQDVEVKLPHKSSETSEIPTQTETGKRKKSWADIAEEEEDDEEYGDENADSFNTIQ